MMAIRDEPSWKALTAEPDSPLATDWKNQILRNASPEDARELVDVCLRGTAVEARAAVALLMRLSKKTPPLLDAATTSSWVEWLEARVREAFPSTALSLVCYAGWRSQNREAALRFLTEELSLDGVTDAEALSFVVAQLSSYAAFGSREAARRLEELQGLPEGPAEERDRVLASLTPATPAEIARLAREWRRSRSPKALFRIYNRYISTLEVGKVSIEEIVRLLGPPTERRGNDVWYQPNSGTQLFLEGDAEGRLRAHRLS